MKLFKLLYNKKNKVSFYPNIHFNFFSDTDCKTIGGNHVGAPCQFPFMYNLWDDMPYIPNIIRYSLSILTPNKFDTCTDYQNSGIKWCATKITSDGHYIPGYWGKCPDTIPCNTDEGTLSK